jgi:hypothetical protein
MDVDLKNSDGKIASELTEDSEVQELFKKYYKENARDTEN